MYPFWLQPPAIGSQRAPPCLRYLPFTWQPRGEHVRDRGGISIHRDTTSSLHLSSLPSLPGCVESRHPGSLSLMRVRVCVCAPALPLLRAEIRWCWGIERYASSEERAPPPHHLCVCVCVCFLFFLFFFHSSAFFSTYSTSTVTRWPHWSFCVNISAVIRLKSELCSVLYIVEPLNERLTTQKSFKCTRERVRVHTHTHITTTTHTRARTKGKTLPPQTESMTYIWRMPFPFQPHNSCFTCTSQFADQEPLPCYYWSVFIIFLSFYYWSLLYTGWSLLSSRLTASHAVCCCFWRWAVGGGGGGLLSCFNVFIIHRTLPWTTGSLTFVLYSLLQVHTHLSVYSLIRRILVHSRHRIFTPEK